MKDITCKTQQKNGFHGQNMENKPENKTKNHARKRPEKKK